MRIFTTCTGLALAVLGCTTTPTPIADSSIDTGIDTGIDATVDGSAEVGPIPIPNTLPPCINGQTIRRSQLGDVGYVLVRCKADTFAPNPFTEARFFAIRKGTEIFALSGTALQYTTTHHNLMDSIVGTVDGAELSWRHRFDDTDFRNGTATLSVTRNGVAVVPSTEIPEPWCAPTFSARCPNDVTLP